MTILGISIVLDEREVKGNEYGIERKRMLLQGDGSFSIEVTYFYNNWVDYEVKDDLIEAMKVYNYID